MEGESMSEWKEVRLEDYIEFNPYRKLKKGNKAKKITMDMLIPYSKQIYDYIVEPYNGGAKFQNGDTIMARITPCLENGKHAYINILDKDEIAYGSTEYIVLCGKDDVTDNEFVYYFSHSPIFKNTAIKSMVGSSGRQRAQTDVLKDLVVNIPISVSEQQEIAGILSSLDAKIETNNKLNEKLEEMAQAIFKSWFVDFEPFKDMPFHETELGMIPEGWEVGIFDDIVDIVGGGTPSKSISEYYTDNGIAWITPKDLSLNNNKFTSKGTIDITELGYEKSSAKLMPKGSVLFSSRAPIGYITIAKNEICTNQGFKSAVPKKAGTAFVYYLLKNKTIEIENMATGSTFKEASGTLMKNLKIIIPLDKVLDDFEKIIMPIFEFQMSVEEQNDRLASLRDTLLPRLMSGELKV